MKDPKSLKHDAFLVLVVGIAAFFLAFPISVLDPTNIAWLQRGDLAAHYLGWAFFRDAPAGVAPGQNLGWGLELSSSVFYSDSIPLLALPSRWLSSILPKPFQYFGFWLLACFILQAWFGLRLIKNFGISHSAAAAFLLLVCIFPPLLYRMSMHVALSAHWLILAALCEYFDREAGSNWRWAGIVFVAALVHAYILAMILAIWVAGSALGISSRRMSFKVLACGSVGVLVAVLCGLWMGGFFVGSAGGRVGFGLFQTNLFAPLDSNGLSLFLPDMPNVKGNEEGYAYLGLGVLLLVIVASISIARGAYECRLRRVSPLLIVSVIMLAYAISNRVSLLGHDLELFSIPRVFEPVTGTLRSSGRFAWPLLYFLALGAFVVVCRVYKERLKWLLPLIVMVQIADAAPALMMLRDNFRGHNREWNTPLKSVRWQEIASENMLVRKIPAGNRTEDWDVFADYALRYGLGTDSIYLGRVDDESLRFVQRRSEQVIVSGGGQEDEVYILDLPSARSFQARGRPGQRLELVDGYWVLFPSHFPAQNILNFTEHRNESISFAVLPFGKVVDVGQGESGYQLTGLGWAPDWRGGVYAKGGISELVFLADVAERTAVIRLEGGCMESLIDGTVLLNDRPIDESAVMIDGAGVELEVDSNVLRKPPQPNVLGLQWSRPIASPWNLRQAHAFCAVPSLQRMSLRSAGG